MYRTSADEADGRAGGGVLGMTHEDLEQQQQQQHAAEQYQHHQQYEQPQPQHDHAAVQAAQDAEAEAHAAATRAHYTAVAASAVIGAEGGGGAGANSVYNTADFGTGVAAPAPAFGALGFGASAAAAPADFGVTGVAPGTTTAAAAAAAIPTTLPGLAQHQQAMADPDVRRPVSDLTVQELRDIVSRLLPTHGEAVSTAASDTQGGPAGQRPRITVVDDSEVHGQPQAAEPWDRFRTDTTGVGGLSVTDTSFLNTLATTARQQQQQRATSSIVARASHRERIIKDNALVDIGGVPMPSLGDPMAAMGDPNAALQDPNMTGVADPNAPTTTPRRKHPNSSSAGPATSEKMRDYQAQLNAAWMERFAQLTMFKAQHGHCRPPQSEALGAWCGHQRQKYRDRSEGKLTNLTEERIALLETVGFDFKTEKKNRHQKPAEDGRRHGPRNPERSFEDWVEELRWYRERHGSADVPVKGNPKLGAWVVRQRQHYRKLNEGGRSSLTPERIATLESLGFVWVSSRCRQKPDGSSRPKGPRLRWGEWYDRLAAHKEKYGTCKVSTADRAPDPKLGKWVEWQRQCYKMWKRGERSSMNEEKCAKLEELGMLWEPRPGKEGGGREKGPGGVSERNSHTPFEDWVEQFKKYKADNDGDANVPRKVPRLGSWVGQQRKHYKLLQEGKPSRLTPERIAMLEEAGFLWSVRQPRDKSKPRKSRVKDSERKRAPFDRSPQLKFEEWVDQLKEFKAEHGHVRVNVGRKSPTPKLGRWVDSQRQFYKKREKGLPTSLTQERVDLLNELGFIWTTRGDKSEDGEKMPKAPKRKRGRPSKADIDAQIAEKLRIKRQRRVEGLPSDGEEVTRVYGPSSAADDGDTTPVKRKRGRPKGSKNKKKGKGKKAQKKKSPKKKKKKPAKKSTKSFADWMELLAAYGELHGHVNVDVSPESKTPHLGRWVNSQRKSYKRMVEGQDSDMVQSRVDELEELEFDWDVPIAEHYPDTEEEEGQEEEESESESSSEESSSSESESDEEDGRRGRKRGRGRPRKSTPVHRGVGVTKVHSSSDEEDDGGNDGDDDEGSDKDDDRDYGETPKKESPEKAKQEEKEADQDENEKEPQDKEQQAAKEKGDKGGGAGAEDAATEGDRKKGEDDENKEEEDKKDEDGGGKKDEEGGKGTAKEEAAATKKAAEDEGFETEEEEKEEEEEQKVEDEAKEKEGSRGDDVYI